MGRSRRASYIEAIAVSENERDVTDAVAALHTFTAKMKELAETYHVNLSEPEESFDWVGASLSIVKSYKENLSELKNWVVAQQKSVQLKEHSHENRSC